MIIDDAPPPMRLFLKRLLTRSVLTEVEQRALAALPGREQEIEANREFVTQGEYVDHACVVIDGLIARFAQTESGDRQIVMLHIPGDPADLQSTVAPAAIAPLQALTRSRILRIPHRALIAVANEHPAIAHAFWRDGIVDLGIVAQSLLSIGRRRALTRLAHLLCEITVRYEQIGFSRDAAIEFPITQVQLGDTLGLTPVHVNRMVKALRDAGLCRLAERRLEVLNWSGLAQVAEFDPAYLQLQPLDRHG